MYINLEPGIRKLSIPTITETIIEQFFDSKKIIYVYENNKIAKVSNIK